MKSKREFETGANRNSSEGKLDYEGFISPLVERIYAEYMHKHRLLEDGTLRSSDNWQKGIPYEELMKSAHRHWQDVRLIFDGYMVTEDGEEVDMIDALCGLKFNIEAMILSITKEEAISKSVERNYQQYK